jgi:acetyltransferase-like isoleucine patch superfamily enzyme
LSALIAIFIRCVDALYSRVLNIWFRALGTRMTGLIWLRRVSIPRQWTDITLDNCALDDHVTLLCSGAAKRGKITIGEGSYINRFTIIDAHESIVIGSNCMIGPHTFITDADHGTAASCLVKDQPMSSAPVRIGDGAWIGAGVVILKGVNIGDGAIIGAGAVVTRDVSTNTIVAGVPARGISTRQ